MSVIEVTLRIKDKPDGDPGRVFQSIGMRAWMFSLGKG